MLEDILFDGALDDRQLMCGLIGALSDMLFYGALDRVLNEVAFDARAASK